MHLSTTRFRSQRVATVAAAAAAAALLLMGGAAHAESLRCNGSSLSEGDSRLAVLYKCGQPVLADSFCAPVIHVPSQRFVNPALVGLVAPCQPVDEWLYDRGPGNLMAIVRLRGGVVQSIRYGQLPR